MWTFVYCATRRFFFDLPDGADVKKFDIETPATYTYVQFKNEVDAALRNYLGSAGVKRGRKAIDVHENTYRVDADVVPCFEFRSYYNDGSYLTGTAFIPDGGFRVVNWPEQNYENGVMKNNATGGRFKDVTRILKRLRYKMEDEKIATAAPIPSYLIECLVWNVPNEGFCRDTVTADVRWSLAHLFNSTMKIEDCREWGEINEFKYLFRASQPWTLSQTHSFLSDAWDYIGFQ